MDKCPEWFFQLILALLIIKSTQCQGTNCITPIKLPGDCVNINSCLPLLDLHRNYGNAVAEFLQRSQCGWDNQYPKVCCPISNPSSEPSTKRPIETSAITVRGPISLPTTRNSYGPLLAPQCGSPNGGIPKIVGGEPATLGAWPWMAVLGYRPPKPSTKPLWLCDGTLISSRHVLTAAHCVNRNLYIVRLGDLNLNDNVNDGAEPVNVLIEKITIHPDYNPDYLTNDIAMIKLEEDVQFTPNLQPICLPFVKELVNKNFVDSDPYITGWGSLYSRGITADDLQQIQLPVVKPEKCVDAYKSFSHWIIDDRVICAGIDEGGKDVCHGDSGGPMMYPVGRSFYIIGIVSFSRGCAEPNSPAVFTKVGAFTDFIQSNLV